MRGLFHIIVPLVSAAAFIIFNLITMGPWTYALAAISLGFTVLTSVHHAEIIASKVGQSLGTIILALCVTIIEVGLVLVLMNKDPAHANVLARDTVFSAIMIVTNGSLAICLIVGGLKFREQVFRGDGSKSLLVVLIALAFINFFLPNYTTSVTGPQYSRYQMILVSCISVILYGLFIIFQTQTHKEYFEPVGVDDGDEEHEKLGPVSRGQAWGSFAFLSLSLFLVIATAKLLSPAIEGTVAAMKAPKAVVGLLIASIVLLPETLAAASAARANRLQTSVNLALGSGIASIALTIPTVMIYSLFNASRLDLGLSPKNTAFLFMTFFVSSLTLSSGKSNTLQGAVHAVILITYFVLTFIP